MAEALRHGMNSPELRLFRMLEEIRQCAFSSPDKRESTSHSQEHVAVSGAEKEDLRLHQKLERTAYPKFRITAGEKAWEARAPDGSGIGCGSEGQSDERFLFEVVGFGRAGGRAGAGGTLNGTDAEILGLGDALEARKNIEQGAHVGGLFLNPDNFAGVGMRVNGGGDFGFRERIELIKEEHGGGVIVATAAFGAKFVANFAAGDKDALCVGDFRIRYEGEEARTGKFFKCGRRIGMPEHAFGGEDDKRFAPEAAGLAAQQMKILRGG